ncbi:MAG: ATP-dependent protease LonB [archaeon]
MVTRAGKKGRTPSEKNGESSLNNGDSPGISNGKLLARVPKSTADIPVPKSTIEQVIGQDTAAEIIKKAANQRRHILLIGEPGVGKSLLAQGMAELLPREELEDILVLPNPIDENTPIVRKLRASHGRMIVNRALSEVKGVEGFRRMIFFVLFGAIAAITGYYFIVQQQPLILFGGITASVFLMMGLQYTRKAKNMVNVPKVIVSHKRGEVSPFIDATGAYSGALLGDVRHDPFQSGGLETPAHERVEPGAIHRAHKGVLFIDEVATLTRRTQIELLTALQEKKYAITGKSERSSGSMVKTEPVPCDFVLVAAGNLPTLSLMNPALRSRIRGYGYEVYMDDSMPDTPESENLLVRFIAQEIAKDGKIPHFDSSAIKEIIIEARKRAGRKGHLTLKLRELGGLVRAAGDVAKAEGSKIVSAKQVNAAKKIAITLEQQVATKFTEKKKEYQVILNSGEIVGRVNGLAVIGTDSAIVLPIEAETTPGGRKQDIVATGKLGEIAKEAIRNVNAVVRKLYGERIKDTHDIYVQFIQTYEGVEGDSASVAVATAVISAFKQAPVDQSIAMTGSLSIRGEVLPVGGVTPKVEAAIAAGMKKVIIPEANLNDLILSDEERRRIKVIPVRRIEQVLKEVLVSKKPVFRKILSGALPKPATARALSRLF